MSGQENPKGSGSRCNLERVLRILREIIHVFGRSESGLPRLVNRVGVTEERRIPVHVNDVVESAQRIIINLEMIANKIGSLLLCCLQSKVVHLNLESHCVVTKVRPSHRRHFKEIKRYFVNFSI